jgi:hypothetical protein
MTRAGAEAQVKGGAAVTASCREAGASGDAGWSERAGSRARGGRKWEKREGTPDAWGQAAASVGGRRGVARRVQAAVHKWAGLRCGLAEENKEERMMGRAVLVWAGFRL